MLVLTGLGISALALGVAPMLMPASYSWIEHTTSESAAQGVEGAWLARLGFLLLGLSVIWLSAIRHVRWGGWGARLHAGFGVFMVAGAAFSIRPWDASLPFDRTEDVLHSIAATAVGFAFAFGVFAVMLRRARWRSPAAALDLIAIASSIAIPLGMTATPAFAGLLQRAMFLVAYIWFGSEAIREARPDQSPSGRS
jgi:hypothetical protein